MKDLYDLSMIIPVETIPWEEFYTGIAKSIKRGVPFYGYNDDIVTGFNREQSEWYKSIKYGDNLKGLAVSLRFPKNPKSAWYTLGESKNWYETENYKNFPELIKWINDSRIFTETGRILFFIQLIGTQTPPHIDMDLSKAPIEYQKRTEFIWLTDPNNSKQLLVNGNPAGNFAWFDNYQTHETLSTNTTKFSLRIDGKFTDEFKKKLGI
jgi:hypothetical protein